MAAGRRTPMRCRLCGREGMRPFYTQGDRGQFRFYRCCGCGLVSYDLEGGLDQRKYSERPVDPDDRDHPVNEAQRRTLRFMSRHVPSEGRLMEVGCGNGHLLCEAGRRGWDVFGLELSPSLARSVRERLGVSVVEADFMDYETPDEGRFDVVVMRHVLEHLPDPYRAMRKVSRLLRRGGHVVLEVPNIMAPEMRLKRLMSRLGLHRKRYAEGYRPGHCNEFCRRSLAELAGRTGFRLVRWETYSSRPLAGLVYGVVHIGSKARAVLRSCGEGPGDGGGGEVESP